MNPEADSFIRSRIERFSPILAAAVVLIGGLILMGWALDVEFLKGGFPGLQPAKVNAALAFILCGASLWFSNSRRCVFLAPWLAMAAILLSLLTLGEHVLGWNLGLDQILISDYSMPASSHPGRMAPLVSLNFAIVGTSLFLLNSRPRMAQMLALLGSVLGLLGISCFLYYESRSTYGFLSCTQMPFLSSLTFLTLFAGILSFRPKIGFMARFISREPGGIIIRRLLFPLGIFLLVLDWADMIGENAGYYEPNFGRALTTIVFISVLAGVLWWNARDLDTVDEKRRHSEKALRETKDYLDKLIGYANAPIIVWDPQRRITRFNKAFEQLTGYNADEVLGKDLSMLFPEESNVDSLQKVASAVQGEQWKSVEIPILNTSGEVLIVLWNSANIYTKSGELQTTIAMGQDITERKRAEEALRESEQRFRRVSELITDFAYSCMKSPDGPFIIDWMTGAVERITGYTADEIRDMTCWRPLVAEDDIPVFDHNVVGLSPGEWARSEIRIRKKDGGIIWLASFAQCFTDQHRPAYHRIYGGCRDITERKRADKALQESEARYKRIVETANEGIMIMDDQFRYAFVNQKLADMLGYQSEEILGRPVTSFIFEEDLSDHRTKMEMRVSGAGAQYERRHRRKDGNCCWTIVSATPLKDKAGQFAGSFSMLTDITERKRTEAALCLQYDLSLALNSSDDLHQALKHVLEVALSLESIDCGGVYEADPASGTLDLVAQRGLSPQFVAHVSHYAADSPHVRLAQAGEAHFGIDANICPTKDDIHQQEGLRAIAFIPVLSQGKLIATLNLASHTHDEIPASTRNVLETLALQIGNALMRLRSDAALQENELRLRTIFDTSSAGIIVVDTKGRITQANQRMAELFACSLETMIGTPYPAFVHPDERQEGTNLLQSMMENEVDVVCTERHYLRGNGCDFWGYLNGRRMVGPNGEFTGLLGIISDITDRKQAVNALRESEQEKAAILGGLRHVAVEYLDSCMRIIWVNEAVQMSLGLSMGELRGKYCFEILQGLKKPCPGCTALKASETGHSQEGELVTPDGKTWISRGSPIKDSDGNVQGVVHVAMNITERKRAEQALVKKSEDLARSNADLAQFAYAASHDLQEPLRTITRFAQLLQKRYQGKLDSDADEFIDFIVGGTKRMQQLINDLLTYSRINTRRAPLCPMKIEDALHSALQNLRYVLEESRGTVIFEEEEMPTIIADESQMPQLFQNLIGNALKFHGEEAPRVEISAALKGNEWVFSVRDNGIGIDPKYKDRIFEIFQRLHAHEEYPGTGIGLAIAKKIVERHDGHIWVESEPGKGSTFYFTIPRTPERS